MIDQKSLDYIRHARANNLSDEVIKQALMLNGWTEGQASEALISASTAITGTSALAANPGRKHSWNSPLSVMLAVVLFFALLILSNHVVKDLVSTSLSTSGKLIINVFIVLPFLLLAFLLHYSFHEHEQKNKFMIISQPYYFVAGWLLLKLLFQVSQYIMDQNATYGVYAVLVMTVLVLTGIIFFVQKYMRSA
ncbi:MAG: hypothetical protein KW788_00595 [Candidatus Doudnabacteria bacterium]|nr:hypothetical protein [Candidatus Doudnabacteria bacterium]